MTDREKLNSQRAKAVDYIISHYTREQRHLLWYQREMAEYLKSAAWLQTPAAREYQKFWDFISEFESLKNHMREFRWSADFLASHGIDFKSARKLYFAVS